MEGPEPVGSPLAPPPKPRPLVAVASRLSRTAFRYGNRWFVVPLHRAGLAAWLGSPLAGCQLLLTTTGRRSGLPRDTPLGYLVAEGAAWVVAGYGPSTLWYRNLLEDPRGVVRLPARLPFAAVAVPVHDPVVRARIIPRLVRSMPLPGCMIGTNVWTATDERILQLVNWVPLVRIAPVEGRLIAGADDPGGHGWVWRQAVVTLVAVAAFGIGRRRR
ncbi:MAG TPA: nitroreductase family deazaflavin-dependent oxidoreductase [Candidatus Dormibacteraeota bacterium]|nr:nitroreductase family deazaflavin-dependent oxidoreductase [Candidatus Dormibacteraeota bacterium]